MADHNDPQPRGQEEPAAQGVRERAAGERNAAALNRRTALAHARRVYLKDATGLVLPHPADVDAGPAQGDYMTATDLVLAGRMAEGDQALAKAIATAWQASDKGAARRLERLRAQVAGVTHKEGTLPPLVRTGQPAPGTITAIDHRGTEFTITMRNGRVSVTSPAGVRSGPAGKDPTAAARVLAGQLNKQAEEATARAFAALGQPERDRQEQADMRERQARWRAAEGDRDAPPDDGSLLLTEGYRTLGRLSKARRAERTANVGARCDGAAQVGATHHTAVPDIEPEA